MITLEQLVDIQTRVGFAPFTPVFDKGTTHNPTQGKGEQETWYTLCIPGSYNHA